MSRSIGSVYREVGRRVAELRRSAGWTQEELAERVDVAVSYVARIEGGTRRATLETLERLARALDVPLASFFAHPVGRSTPSALEAATQGLSRSDVRLLTSLASRLRRNAHAPRRRSR